MTILLEEKINKLKQRVERMKKKGTFFYLKNIEDGSEPRVFIDQKEKIMLASYNYLGLINHPKLKEAAIKALEKYGTGTAGVRLLSGTTKLHEELEAKIAEFKSAEDAITYTSGYVTNLAVITSLYQKGDLVIIDKIDHASIIDGCILSGARYKTFLHNDMHQLERVLANSEEFVNKIVVVDGIEEYFGLNNAVDIHMGTLSKTIPSVGGYIAGDKDIIEYLKHNSRPFIFSAPLPPVTVAVAKASLEVIEDEPERIENLQKNMKRFKEGIDSMGYNTGGSVTAIVPIIVGDEEDTLELCKEVNNEGIFICPILFPAIPRGTNRLRAHVLTTHTFEDIDKALDIFERAGKKLGLIR